MLTVSYENMTNSLRPFFLFNSTTYDYTFTMCNLCFDHRFTIVSTGGSKATTGMVWHVKLISDWRQFELPDLIVRFRKPV